MKVKEIVGKSEKELTDLLKEKRKELFNLKMDNKQNKLKNTRSLFNTRKDIRKVLTLIRQQQLSASANVEVEAK
jgi:large subunit ribosomal protein L29